MVKIAKSTVVEAPVEAVWEVLRDFNGHDQWHPAVADSHIERGQASDRIGCIRRFHLADGSELREQLLTLSDIDMAFSYCLLDTPIPLLNYVAHVRLIPVTDGDMTFWQWESRFNTPAGREAELKKQVGEEIYEGGFRAVREFMGLAPSRIGGG
ncbi:SRPBCC family protein [Aquamicrobium sp. LC103]|uniref:SRPBCC family protein n=1 Tax=Aquamicrobium sp. LC103 TaxID=1120658 RepID=UPI00063ED1AF|nr:SRPBCC family protein [Aquamicrobium sp. LC103]TKT76219.1 SRPBCC family protein [Aquamicrobium sp. LC103]